MRAGEPPVLAIDIGEGSKKCQKLRLATGAAGKADEAEDAGARRQHHRIARIGGEVLLYGCEPGHAAAVDDGGERVHVAALAMRQGRSRLARLRSDCLGLLRLVLALPPPCPPPL